MFIYFKNLHRVKKMIFYINKIIIKKKNLKIFIKFKIKLFNAGILFNNFFLILIWW